MKKAINLLILIIVIFGLTGCTEEIPETINQDLLNDVSATIKEGSEVLKTKVLTKENTDKVIEGAKDLKDKVFTDKNTDKIKKEANEIVDKIFTKENVEKATDGATSIIKYIIEDATENDSSEHISFQKATVSRVVDGDTIIAKLGKNEFKIRFVGVNSPESVGKYKNNPQPYGLEASKFTKDTLKVGRTIYLESDVGDKDKYGRLLRYIWLEMPSEINEQEISKKMYNAILLKKGMANTMTIQPNVKYSDVFVKIEATARENNIGLWGEQ